MADSNEQLFDEFADLNALEAQKKSILGMFLEVKQGLKSLQEAGISIDQAKGMKGLNDGLKQQKKANDDLSAAVGKYNQVLAENIKLQAKIKSLEGSADSVKAKKEETKATEENIKAKQRESKLIDEAVNDYLQLSKAYNEAALKAKNYVLRLGENHPIAVQAVKDANDLGTVLKKLDASVGQNQRNVGNYASAFNGLGFSFTQVARELPSLAINFQTFALAISNNLPMVADEIAKAKKEIAALKAEGKDTPSLFQKIKQGILSPQVALSALIGLFTIFSGKLFGSKASAEAAKKAVDELNKSFEAQKKAINDAIDALNDFTQIDVERLKRKGATDKEIFNREIEGEKENNRIRKDLRQQLTSEIEQLEKKEAILIAASKDDLVRKATREDREVTRAKIDAKRKQYADLGSEIEKGERSIILKTEQFRTEEAEKAREAAKKKLDEAKERTKNAKDAADAELQFQFEIKAIQLQQTIDFNREIAADEDKMLYERLAALRRAKDAATDLIIERAALEKQLGEKTATEITLIEQQKLDKILRLNRDFLTERRDIHDQEKEQRVQDEKDIADALENGIRERYERFARAEEARTKKAKEEGQKRLKDEEEIAKRREELEQQLISELTTLVFTAFSSKLEMQKNAIQEQIDVSEKNRQREIEAVNNSVLTAQEKADKIAVIEARYNAKKEQLVQKQRQLDNKRAEFERAQAIVRTIQETAFNIVKVFPNPVLMALAAAIGAVQLGIIAAQPIPKYNRGRTANDPYEGPALVGDQGREIGISREGRVMMYDKPTLTHLYKGDRILPNHVTEQMIRAAETERAAVISAGLNTSTASATADYSFSEKADSMIKELKDLNRKSRIIIQNAPGVESTAWYQKNIKQ